MSEYDISGYDSDPDDAPSRRRGDDEAIDGEDDSSASFVDNGIIIEPFHMKSERNEGYIDSSGHFVENRNWKDAWLDDLDEQEKSRAKSAKNSAPSAQVADDNDDEDDDDSEEEEDGMTRRRKSNTDAGGDTDDDEDIKQSESQPKAKGVGQKRKIQAAEVNEQRQRESLNPLVLKQQLLQYVQPGETVLSAIKRLGRVASQQPSGEVVAGKYGKANKAGRTRVDEDVPLDQSIPRRAKAPISAERQKVQAVTELADQLLGTGLIGVYDETYESLSVALHRAQTATSSAPAAAAAAPASKQWQYKVSATETAVYGPFPTESMLSWQQQGHLPATCVVRAFDAYTDDDDEFLPLTYFKQFK